MSVTRRLIVVGILVPLFLLVSSRTADSQDEPVAGYQTRLILHGPIVAGAGQTITGEGAPPTVSTIFVELWRVPFGTRSAESIMTVEAQSQGFFSFPNVDVNEGDQLFVTMSRGWNFETDGDFEGWDGDVSPDAQIDVSGGTLNMTVTDGNFDGFIDPYFLNNVSYNPNYYRAIEIRLRVTGAPSVNNMMVFWGAPWPNQIRYHRAQTPGDMSDFETVVIPLNIGEFRVTPFAENNVDNLWIGGSHNALRITPTSPPPGSDPSGIFIQIDSIRIREDFRFDFNVDGDLMGLSSAVDVQDVAIQDGFLTYTVTGPNPSVGLEFFDAGFIETSFQSRFVLGMNNGAGVTGTSTAGLAFPGDDAQLGVDLGGRQDVHDFVDAMTVSGSGWSNMFTVDAIDLRLLLPQAADPTQTVRVDYIGLVPTDPFGPSAAEFVTPTNTPPTAVVTSVPSPAVVQLADGSASISLDGSGSDDGDGGAQGLTYSWSQTSGPGIAAFDSATTATAVVTFSVAGDYEFELTVDDGDMFYSSDSAMIAVTVEPEPVPVPEDVVFMRGDVDTDGKSMEVQDALKLLRFLFLSRHGEPSCHDAADVDDNGRLNIRDAVLILRYHFGLRRLPASFLTCNPDETEDDLPECDYPEELCGEAIVKTRRPWRARERSCVARGIARR